MPRKNNRAGYSARNNIRLARLCGAMSQGIRKTVFNLCAGRCAYCGKKLRFKHLTVDHIQPLSRDGANEIDNMLPACGRCNEEKSDMILDAFREARGGKLYFETRGRSIEDSG
jgi:5-methylcytosine-specific restriction endonuclease McrA